MITADDIQEEAPYLHAFGLREHPFRLAPNPKFAYRTESTSEALVHARSVIAGRLGFGCISGDIGTGKTTLAGILANEAIDAGHAVASLYRIPGGARQSEARILREINRDLSLELSERQSGERSLQRITEYAIACRAEKKALVVMIDEAHQLRSYGIGTLRAILGLASDTAPLIQVLLFGQSPEMMNVIKSDRALHSRLSIHTHLEPLSEADVASMITHRLGAAGRTKSLFTPDAFVALSRYARGIPRIACTLAHRAAVATFERHAKTVTDSDVTLAAQRLAHE